MSVKDVLVVGATGGCGRLVARRLLAEEDVQRVLLGVRDESKARGMLGDLLTQSSDSKKIEVVEMDVTRPETLGPAMKGVSHVLFCAGTTAFPSSRWRGGNTPHRACFEGVKNLLSAADTSLVRWIHLSSVGISRRSSFPFSILNSWGVLDAIGDAEELIKREANDKKFEYSLVRAGRLIGEPFSNPDLATLFKLEAPEKLAIKIRRGDIDAGDLARGSLAEVMVRAISDPDAANQEFTAVNDVGPQPTYADKLFESLKAT